jgi:hypothetical protein
MVTVSLTLDHNLEKGTLDCHKMPLRFSGPN